MTKNKSNASELCSIGRFSFSQLLSRKMLSVTEIKFLLELFADILAAQSSVCPVAKNSYEKNIHFVQIVFLLLVKKMITIARTSAVPRL